MISANYLDFYNFVIALKRVSLIRVGRDSVLRFSQRTSSQQRIVRRFCLPLLRIFESDLRIFESLSPVSREIYQNLLFQPRAEKASTPVPRLSVSTGVSRSRETLPRSYLSRVIYRRVWNLFTYLLFDRRSFPYFFTERSFLSSGSRISPARA